MLVVGSFASGSDIARQIASLNLGYYDPSGRPLTPDPEETRRFTRVYVSSSGAPSPMYSVTPDDPSTPWMKYIDYRPLISHVAEDGVIHLQDKGGELSGVDTIIYATGYNFSLPFCKVTDAPWRDMRILDDRIRPGERDGGSEGEVGGMKGLGVEGLDPLLLFLENDQKRSIAFPVLRQSLRLYALAR